MKRVIEYALIAVGLMYGNPPEKEIIIYFKRNN